MDLPVYALLSTIALALAVFALAAVLWHQPANPAARRVRAAIRRQRASRR